MQLGKGASVFGLLLFGTATSLFAKIVYQLEDDRGKLFMKPWAMTTVMFVGMSFCLPLSFLEGSKRVDEDDIGGNGSEPLLTGEGGDGSGRRKHSELKETLMLAIPTVFDLIATVLMNVGLLSVTASVYQMMRGAEMVFAAMFAIVFLKRTLNKWHYLGITCCIAGITLVGLSSMLSGETGHHEAAAVAARLATDREAQWKILLGILLIIASQAVQAAQVTFEDYFMSDMDVPPMKIVGYEGLFGTVMMVGVMLPLVHWVPGKEGSGLHEDSLDTLYMITHSKTIAPVLLVDMLALLAYNVTGMSVTGHLGAVFRTVLETMRTLFVWLVDLLLFYALGGLGEAWTSYSFVQLAGFAVLVVGTLLYGRGDEQEVLQEMEKLASGSEGGAAPPSPPPPPPPAAAAHPIAAGARAAAQPMAIGGTPGSFKATMNMTSGSFRAQMSASLRASGRGSTSRSLGA